MFLAFRGTAIRELDLSTNCLTGLKNIGRMYQNCEQLVTFKMPSNKQNAPKNLEHMEYSFSGCKNINFGLSSVTKETNPDMTSICEVDESPEKFIFNFAQANITLRKQTPQAIKNTCTKSICKM